MLFKNQKTFWQTTFAFTFIVNLVILIWSISRWTELKVILWRSVWVIPLAFYLAALAGCVFLFFWIRKGNADRLLAALELDRFSAKAGWRIAAGAVFAGILLLIPYLKFTFRIGEVVKKSTQDPVLTTIVFYWAVWWLILVAAGALKVAFKTSWAGGFASALVILGVVYEIFVRFQLVTTYPFSLGWSEASRFYYGSLYFSQSIYGVKAPLSSMHPSRYFLQSFPFLFPGLGLMFSRFWQVFLWVALTGVTAVSLSWRVFTPSPLSRNSGEGLGVRALFAGWIFLFLLRVGVYYHLEIMVFVPLLFVSAKHPSPGKRWGLWRSLAAVIFASAWAGVSRVNWFPMPAMIAIAIYLLEEPFHVIASERSSASAAIPAFTELPVEREIASGRSSPLAHRPDVLMGMTFRYLAVPALWAVTGLLAALAAQMAYIPLSGNAGNAQAFASSFTSEKLWYRLWPNDLYPLGIVPAILIVSGPLLAILILATVRRFKELHPIRWVGLWGMLIVLFAGGLVVSVKIGGGGDLHNMDAYAVLISVAAAWFIGGKVNGEKGQIEGAGSWPIAAVALLIPLIFIIPALSSFQKFNQNANQDAFRQLKGMAEQAGQNGPVLFIKERHLITFHQINVPLVPDYEAVTLMEMAMSNNQPYLQQFYSDLRNHRFAAIVTDKQNVGIKEEGAFAEESNTWNLRVSPYIQCYYEPVTIATIVKNKEITNITYIEADESRIEFYMPRITPPPVGVCP